MLMINHNNIVSDGNNANKDNNNNNDSNDDNDSDNDDDNDKRVMDKIIYVVWTTQLIFIQ